MFNPPKAMLFVSYTTKCRLWNITWPTVCFCQHTKDFCSHEMWEISGIPDSYHILKNSTVCTSLQGKQLIETINTGVIFPIAILLILNTWLQLRIKLCTWKIKV